MAVNEITVGRGYPLPHPDNLLDEDVQRIRNALSAVDGDMAALIALGLLAGRFNGALTIAGDLFVKGERVGTTLSAGDTKLEIKDTGVDGHLSLIANGIEVARFGAIHPTTTDNPVTSLLNGFGLLTPRGPLRLQAAHGTTSAHGTPGAGASLQFFGGNADPAVSDAAGGLVNIGAGNSTGTAQGAPISFKAGNSDTGPGGNIQFTGGSGGTPGYIRFRSAPTLPAIDLTSTAFAPLIDNSLSLGTASYRWANIHTHAITFADGSVMTTAENTGSETLTLSRHFLSM